MPATRDAARAVPTRALHNKALCVVRVGENESSRSDTKSKNWPSFACTLSSPEMSSTSNVIQLNAHSTHTENQVSTVMYRLGLVTVWCKNRGDLDRNRVRV